jgi:pimeloyl-ACP methyl ester carboxylesterase
MNYVPDNDYQSEKGFRVKYLERGKGSPLIFLHAALYSSEGYPDLIRILSERYRVFAIDMPFHGRSGNSNGRITTEEMCELLKDFISWKKIENPTIIAHSAGAVIAIMYASNNPVSSLMLIGPMGLPHSISFLKLMFKWIFQKTYFDYIQSIRAGNVLVKTGALTILKNLFNGNMVRLLRDGYRTDYGKFMEGINCPTKLFFSKRDELLPLTRAEDFRKKIKNSEIIEVDGTHDWPIVKPQLIIPHLKKDGEL